MRRVHLAGLVGLLVLAGCAEATAPNGTGFAAGKIDGKAWVADSAVAILQDSTLVVGAIRHTNHGRVDGFTAMVRNYRVPLQIELADPASPASAFFSDAPDDGSFLEAGPTQVTDSLYRGLLRLEQFSSSDSVLIGTIAFATAPKYQFPSHTIAVHFRMRLVSPSGSFVPPPELARPASASW